MENNRFSFPFDETIPKRQMSLILLRLTFELLISFARLSSWGQNWSLFKFCRQISDYKQEREIKHRQKKKDKEKKDIKVEREVIGVEQSKFKTEIKKQTN